MKYYLKPCFILWKKIFKKYLRQFQKWKKHEFLQSGKNQDREIEK